MTSGQVLKWSGSAWAAVADIDTNSGGIVTNVSSANVYLSVANLISTLTLTLNLTLTLTEINLRKKT